MIELRLTHDGTMWIAEHETFTAQGRNLEELDREIEHVLRLASDYGVQEPIPVTMTFDNKIIPEWIRQYSGHYFNRRVLLFSRDQ